MYNLKLAKIKKQCAYQMTAPLAFSILELDPNKSYSLENVKKRFYELTKKYHPDGKGEFNNNKNFIYLSEAYNFLNNRYKDKKRVSLPFFSKKRDFSPVSNKENLSQQSPIPTPDHDSQISSAAIKNIFFEILKNYHIENFLDEKSFVDEIVASFLLDYENYFNKETSDFITSLASNYYNAYLRSQEDFV